MENKFIALAAVALVLCAGAAYAAFGFGGFDIRMPGGMGHANWASNSSGNFTGPLGRGWQELNGSGNGTYAFVRRGVELNVSFNSTAAKDFRSAVLSGDYQAAESLHSEYGFGGPIFNMLNETTFATYSQIASLTQALRQELGLNNTAQGAAGFNGALHGVKEGFRAGRGRMGRGFRPMSPPAAPQGQQG